jgi:hypothetical protein
VDSDPADSTYHHYHSSFNGESTLDSEPEAATEGPPAAGPRCGPVPGHHDHGPHGPGEPQASASLNAGSLSDSEPSLTLPGLAPGPGRRGPSRADPGRGTNAGQAGALVPGSNHPAKRPGPGPLPRWRRGRLRVTVLLRLPIIAGATGSGTAREKPRSQGGRRPGPVAKVTTHSCQPEPECQCQSRWPQVAARSPFKARV